METTGTDNSFVNDEVEILLIGNGKEGGTIFGSTETESLKYSSVFNGGSLKGIIYDTDYLTVTTITEVICVLSTDGISNWNGRGGLYS